MNEDPNTTLPSSRGKTYILRLLSVYADLFKYTYGFMPAIPFSRFGRGVKTLMETKTEMQIAALLIIFFDWQGMNGMDQWEHQKLLDATHTPWWFFSCINQYEAYLRNVHKLQFDDPLQVREFVALSMGKITQQ